MSDLCPNCAGLEDALRIEREEIARLRRWLADHDVLPEDIERIAKGCE